MAEDIVCEVQFVAPIRYKQAVESRLTVEKHKCSFFVRGPGLEIRGVDRLLVPWANIAFVRYAPEVRLDRAPAT